MPIYLRASLPKASAALEEDFPAISWQLAFIID